MVRRLCLVALTVGALGGCEVPVVRPDRDAAQPREPVTEFSAAPGYDPDWSAARSARKGPRPPGIARPTPPRQSTIDDPLRGRWTLQQATATLPAGEQLVATLTTSAGELSCQLWPKKAPQAVALFIGLANGLRPWKTKHGWLRRPAFDGTRFGWLPDHSVLELSQPPDADNHNIGLTIAPESKSAPPTDRAGLLALRAFDGGPPGMALLLTTGPTKALAPLPDGGPNPRFFTVFGSCGPLEVIQAIAPSPGKTKAKPRKPVTVRRIRVTRK
ncbi:MAG: hypothetical protein JRI68_25530 [Deltaproteobacteria bacterium]|nr:hypothetical protein [Deltaproteobacteria bacterium]